MKTVKGFSSIVKSKLQKVVQLTLLAGFMLTGATQNAQASPWYQERDGIFGEIKYVRACNTGTIIRYNVIAEAGSRTNRVKAVSFKIFSGFVAGVNISGNSIGIPSSAAWRNLETKYNNRYGQDRRWYSVEWYFPLASYIPKTPVRSAIHVHHTGGTTIDLGRIVDFGEIPASQCRTYNDGVFQNY
jgi:hypothetical protein